MITWQETALRLAFGAAMGGVLGFERQIHGRPAGFRTHLLVSTASALFMIVSEYYFYISAASFDVSYVRLDPARLAAGAVTGVGFIGAGVILKMGATIQGLTTAASIWISSAIGFAAGAGLYFASSASLAIAFVSLWLLRQVEDVIPTLRFRMVSVTCGPHMCQEAIEAVIKKHVNTIQNVHYDIEVEASTREYIFNVSLFDRAKLGPMADELAALEGVKRVTVKP